MLLVVQVCISCEMKFKPAGEEEVFSHFEVVRYDRLENRFLTTGDYSAIQQMCTDYPMETRMLLEDMLKIGEVNDPEINSKFLNFFQDTTLQHILTEVGLQYVNMEDINQEFVKSFKYLRRWIPDIKIPLIYTQIGDLSQSIVVGDQSIGISLDKYLGVDFPVYSKFYNEVQRRSMCREMIVADCLTFYLISLYPMKNLDFVVQTDRDLYMGKIMYVVNKATGRKSYDTKFVSIIERYMDKNPYLTIAGLLNMEDYDDFLLAD